VTGLVAGGISLTSGLLATFLLTIFPLGRHIMIGCTIVMLLFRVKYPFG
jgi:hypothetical protein